MADGPVIQHANKTALLNGINIKKVFEIVKFAREAGVYVPIILMGYYNPVYKYGEQKFVMDAKDVGVNGFIIVDLPPEEAVGFRGYCSSYQLTFVPLIAPSTPPKRLEILLSISDSFIYIVSRMGITGVSNNGTLSVGLPALCQRVRKYSGSIPIVVGFGISTRDHFLSVGTTADGIVVGSRIISVINEAAPGSEENALENYCKELKGIDQRGNLAPKPTRSVGILESTDGVLEKKIPSVTCTVDQNHQLNSVESASNDITVSKILLPAHFGEFGGSYVPESLIDCLRDLEVIFSQAVDDPKFWEEFRSYYRYMGRPSHLQLADRLTAKAGGARIWLKREDLNHTGSHKINNAMGQILLAKRLGKSRVIAETGAGQHGVATATVAAKFGLKCTIYMGSEDVRRQALNVFRMKLLGAEVIAVETGEKTLRDAVNEALRSWVVDLDTTHYVIGSAIGPHPFPTIVRTSQSVIGKETMAQMEKARGKLPDAVVACVGFESNCAGMFTPFVNSPSVQLLGVEAGGDGVQTLRHSGTLVGGTKGILHGVRTYIIQNEEGQVQETHSVSAGLDYPGVGPELAYWKDTGRATFMAVTDAEAFEGFKNITQLEGIIPALESAHAIFGGMKLASTMNAGQDLVISLSGRGDKDVGTVSEELPRLGPLIGWDLRF